MSTFYGADTKALRNLALLIRRTATKIDSVQPQISRSISSSGWDGPDAAAFDSLWRSDLVPTTKRVAESLRTVADTLVRNADEQDAASLTDPGKNPFKDAFKTTVSTKLSENKGSKYNNEWGVGDQKEKIKKAKEQEEKNKEIDKEVAELRKQGKDKEADDLAKTKKTDDPKVTVKFFEQELWNLEKEVVGAKAEAEGEWGEGKAYAKALYFETDGKLVADSNGLKASATVGIGLAAAGASGMLGNSNTNVSGKVDAYVGAKADGNVSVGKDGLSAGASAFAGAKVEGGVSGQVAGIGAGVKGEAWAGIGAEAKATIGRNDEGKITVGAKLGVGLGLGGSVSFEITIDPKEMFNPGGVVDAVKGVGSGIMSLFGRK